MSDRPASRVLELATSIPWAILEGDLRRILAIAERHLADPRVIEREAGRQLHEDNRRILVRDGIAQIRARGPLFRYANLFTSISGATSLELLARDLSTAVEDDRVKAIILAVDSPGGEVNGTSEMARLIFEARGTKPIVAHVSGMGASGAYWLASATDEIVAVDTALVGSVGVIEVIDDREADAQDGIRVYEFVSSVSPRKRPDPATAEGAAEFQRIVDHLGQVFAETVGEYRGVSLEDVLANYGQGAVFVGEEAVDAGLVDRLATLEELHSELVARTTDQALSFSFSRSARADYTDTSHRLKEEIMADTKTPPSADPKPDTPPAAEDKVTTVQELVEAFPELATQLRAEAATIERTRLLAIEDLQEPGQEALIRTCKEDPACSAGDAALRIREADRTKRAAALAAAQDDEKELKAPSPVTDADVDGESADALARQMIANHARLTGSTRHLKSA